MSVTKLLSSALLLRPRVLEAKLDQLRSAPHINEAPNLWQLSLWALRMWHRILFRSDTIGTSKEFPVRDNWRARLLQYRALRLPFLLVHGSVNPHDTTGLLSSPERVIRHLLGTHHDGAQFVYDLELLACYPGHLDELRREAKQVLAEDSKQSRWLRDLAVYQGYHEALSKAVDDYIERGCSLAEDERDNPDISFVAAMDWCASQPATPEETWRLWRSGRYNFEAGRC